MACRPVSPCTANTLSVFVVLKVAAMRIYAACYLNYPDGEYWRLFFQTKRQAEAKAEELRLNGHPCVVRSTTVPNDPDKFIRWLNRIAYNL